MRSMESKASTDTRCSFSGTPTKRRTSAKLCGVTPGRQTVSATPSAMPRTKTPWRLANGNDSLRGWSGS